MSLEARLREIKEICEKATPGPWDVEAWGEPLDEMGHLMHGLYVKTVDDPQVVAVIHTGATEPPEQAMNDAGFIARARTYVHRLVAYCEILAQAVKATEDWYTHTEDCQECGKNGRYCALALSILRNAGDAHRTAVKMLETGEIPRDRAM